MLRSSLPRVGGGIALALVLLVGSGSVLEAQIPGLRDAARRLGDRTPDVSRLLEGEPPITTELRDAVFAVDSLDNFTPSSLDDLRSRGVLTVAGFPVDSLDNMPLQSLLDLRRTPNGGFVLEPGYYEMHTQSYCLKAGTYGPGGGDGYLYAPPTGPAEEAVMMILRNSVDKQEIPQQKIQQLLWAIIARTKFEDLRSDLKTTAALLLSPQQLAMLNRTALDLVPGPALDAAMNRVPPLVRQVLQAEAELRQMLTSAEASFEQMERVAVLAGVAPRGEGSREVSAGRWSKHPDGYFVRYLPQGYSYTVTQIWVPNGSPAVGKEYDPATHIAVPGNTARQRLIQSGRAHTRTE